MTDAERYAVTLRKVRVDDRDLWRATVMELPDLAEFAETRDEALDLAFDTIRSLQASAAEDGRPFPEPISPTPAATFQSVPRSSDKRRCRWYSVQDYINAFRSIEQRMSSSQRAMLLGHYAAPARRLSEAKLANIAGYSAGSAANLQYGRLAGLVADALGYKPPSEKTWTLALWDPHGDENCHGEWVLRQEVASALEGLGWV